MTGSHQNSTHSASHTQQDKASTPSPCDYCNSSRSVLYCRADSAKLCFKCDREVHSTNQLFSKHTRTLLCDSCYDSPASILCSTESSVLCHNCDWESHNLSLPTVHERGPLEGFTACPSVSELLTILGFEDVGKKALLYGDGGGGGGDGGGGEKNSADDFMGCEIEGFSDFFVWDAPSVVSLDDLISSSAPSHNFQAMEVPPLPKNRKSSCGRHREEILSQLRELANSEPLDLDSEQQQYLQSGNMSTDLEHDFKTDKFPSYEWHRRSSEPMNQVVPLNTLLNEEVAVEHPTSAVSENNEGKTPISFKSETVSVVPKATPCELTSQERDSALLRYKQKKKTRRYEKHIRYESRKVRAQSRIRVKGRFAKMEH
ncbi:zinc finger protein CONSTANS-LIKE 13 [Arachis stenosperma]|uniref:zinc finger protein CONSTANS-LIKE 13 n=1 Tax=Arachis stenosperma TaxID=217475 RepID=UPI0025AD497A|nr:zinc finger protein CONSTANS-LIKE 13 [Arachis stenosperma]